MNVTIASVKESSLSSILSQASTMVMEAEVRQGDASFLWLDEDIQVVLVEPNRDTKTPVITVMDGRDDSTCWRKSGSLDNTLPVETMNTDCSILDLTKDDEDDSDDEEEQSQSLLFEELQSSHHSAPAAAATPAFQIPCFQTVTDSFVDSLCHGSSPTCDVSAACYFRPAPSISTSTSEPYSQRAPHDQLRVCVDVWELLGCTSDFHTASGAYWTTSTVSSNPYQHTVPPSNKAIRASRQQRKNQLDRWKEQQQLGLIEDLNPTRHGRTTTTSPTSVISKAYTMDDNMYRHQPNQHHHPFSEHPLAHVIGQDIDGYDSDPEYSFDTARQSVSPHSSLMDNDEEEEKEEVMDTRSEDERIRQMVQVRQLQFLSYAYTYILQYYLIQSAHTQCS